MSTSEIASEIRDDIIRRQPELTEFSAIIYEAAKRGVEMEPVWRRWEKEQRETTDFGIEHPLTK